MSVVDRRGESPASAGLGALRGMTPAEDVRSTEGPHPRGPHRLLITDATQGGVLGGSLTGVLEFLEHLDRRRFEPVLVLFEPKAIVDELRAQGLSVHVLPTPPRAGGHASRRGGRAVRFVDTWRAFGIRAGALVRLLRRERPALIYCSNGVTPSLPVVAAGALLGIPVICHIKGFGRPGLAARLLSRRVDVAICMTDELADHARARGIRPRRFLTVFDGVDLSAWVDEGGAAVRQEFGVPPDAPLVGIVGHIQRWKGQMVVVEAVARVRQRMPEIRCLVVGGVHRLGVAYAEELRARIKALGLDDRVLLTGSRRDVAACMSAMDVVLHASDREPFGRVLIEAMAVGRPVIAPREGGPLVIVTHGETGLLVPPRDPEALAAAIVDLLGDPERRRAMGRAARDRVTAVFDIRRHARAMERVFEQVLQAGAQGPVG